MTKAEVQIGKTYVAKVSGKLADVRITRVSPYGGWYGVNVGTLREVRIRSAQRLRREVLPVDRLTQIRNLRAGGMTYEAARDQFVTQESRLLNVIQEKPCTS
jgi:hypothetical protein